MRDSSALRIGRYISTMVVGLALVYTPKCSVTSAPTGRVIRVRPSAKTSAHTLLQDILTSSFRGISRPCMWGTDMAAVMAGMLRESYSRTYAVQRQFAKPTYPIGTSTSLDEQAVYG